jgi:hypothetical protein
MHGSRPECGGAELVETGEEQGGEAYEVAGVFGIGAEFGGEADEAGLEEFLELRRDGVGAREGSVADAVAGGILLASGRDGSARLGAIWRGRRRFACRNAWVSLAGRYHGAGRGIGWLDG